MVREKAQGNTIVKINSVEYAPNKLDIAIGKVEFASKCLFVHKNNEPLMLEDIATFGYPENAVSKSDGTTDGFWIHLRGHKGYIQRIIPPHILPFRHDRLIELNFPITAGLSGSPLFICKLPKCILLGVCLRSHESEKIIDSFTDISEDGKEYKEIITKREQTGLAQDIRDLLPWKPSFLQMDIGQILTENNIEC